MSAAWDNHIGAFRGLLGGATPSGSPAWNEHIGRLNGLLGDQRARQAAQEAARAPAPVAPPPAVQEMPQYPFEPSGGEGPDASQGYGGGMAGGGDFGLQGMMANNATLGAMMDINPGALRAGAGLLGMVNPLAGMGLAGLNMFGNISNTATNVGMLQDLNVNPGLGSMLAGAFGFNGLSGLPGAALNFAMANQTPGFANLSSPQMPGDFNTGGWGGWSDIAAAMGPTAGSAPSSSRDGIEVEQL